MADVWAEVVNFTAPISTGNSDISLSTHSGDTPKAVMFVMVAATADATTTDEDCMSIGAADATNNWVAAHNSEHGSANTDTHRYFNVGAHGSSAGECIHIMPAGATDFLARFVSFGTGKCTINTITAGSAWRGYALFFGGGDLSVDCNKFDAPANSGGTVSPSPGFETTLCLMASTSSAASGTIGTFGGLQFGGFAYNNPTITQACMSGLSRDGRPSGDTNSAVWNAECFGALSSASINYVLSCTAVTSTTFTITNNDANDDTTDDIGYLALGGTGSTWMELFTPSGTSSTSVQYSNPGFEPEFVGFAMTPQTTEATTNTGGDGPGGSFAMSATDGTTERCLQRYEEDASATTDTASRSDDRIFKYYDDLHSSEFADCTMASTPFYASGFQVDQTANNPNTSHYWLGFGFEAGTGPVAGTTGRTNPFIGRSPFRGPI